MTSGRKTVKTPGHPESLSDVPIPVAWIEIEALVSNSTSSAVYVGGPETFARAGGEMGTRLVTDGTRGDRITFNGVDLSTIFVDAQNAGEGVSYTYG